MTLNKELDGVLELLRSHTSIRDYKKEEIPLDKLKSMLVSAQHAASSHFVQAYSVIHITDPEKKDALAALSNNRRQIESAPVLLLFCADLKRLEYACKKQGTSIQNEILENFLVAVIDTALFAQNFVVAAESQNYGICYIGGVRNNPEEISKVVGLPDKTIPLFGMTVGIPDETQLVKPRLPVDAILHENVYNEEKYDVLLDEYDAQLEDYYESRLTNQKTMNWTIGMSDFLSVPRREHMKSFVNSKGFHLK
ncbi:NADPH-dependent oxidoreductase [Bacillus sp. FJAT-29937]|uniref:NADPH-dependent oxidoreductase n=1 Tax=Bacillus sp. FJAT-29937 TaxID=1720553 RepID=UPI0008377056|nr:NADPH-dependent oxidoreductase [Bacillus sp. FJAT-29937]